MNEITFVALQHPLPESAQQELKTLAGEIALARAQIKKAKEAHDNQLIKMAKKALNNGTTALDMTVLALRDRVGVPLTRLEFQRDSFIPLDA
jgi:hypothetical protein